MSEKTKTTKKKNVSKTIPKKETKTEKVKEENIIEPKEKSTESKRLGIILGFVGILILILIISTIISIKNSAKIVEKVQEILSGETTSMIYLVRDGCGYCTLNESNMDSMKKEYNIEYYEVDTSNLTSKDLTKILNLLEIDASDFGTPHTTIVKNNKVLDQINGVVSYNSLFSTLQKNGIIAKDAKLVLNYIDYAQYKKVIKSSTPQIIVLGSSTCHFCLELRPILDEVVKETGVKVNWLYLDSAFTSGKEDGEYNEFLTSLSWFEENENFGTPTTLLVKNGEVQSALSGYREKEDILKFLKQNKLISE